MITKKILTKPLQKNEKIAFICSSCLGDALIAMVTINNLVRNGYAVDVFGNFIYALRDWFPWVSAFSNVPLAEQRKLEAYPVVLHMYDSELAQQIQEWHPS